MKPVEMTKQLEAELEYFDGVLDGYNKYVEANIISAMSDNDLQMWLQVCHYVNRVNDDTIVVFYNRYNESYYYAIYSFETYLNPQSLIELHKCETDMQLYHTRDFFTFILSVL